MMKNSNYLDPIAAVEQPRQDFIRYLLTAYPLRDPHLRYALKYQLEQRGNIWQEPYLEGSQPYQPGKSVAQLVNQGVLHPQMASLFTPSNRPLYEHQEKAVKAVIQKQQNIVVATGTGSGKTECFLLPMLDTLLKEEDNLLIHGVRALILYPMNALVNDQVKRLRKLLCRQDEIRIKFGFYTSRTETKKEKAIEALAAEFSAYESKELKELFAENELRELFTEEELGNLDSIRERLVEEALHKTQQIQCLSREEIWNEPPHILITNYSMLEHMLIRPVERNKIFAASASTFKMLIVDEAHTYNGSTGSEVSMLLERLKVAVGIKKPGHIRCIATSASLGDASVDNQVLEFAEKFFGESFAEVIRGSRRDAVDRLGEPYTLPENFTGEDILGYLSILELPNFDDDLNKWLDQLRGIVPEEQLQIATSQANGDVHKFLWFALKQHPIVHRLINILSRKPQPWEQITQSAELWGVNLPINPDGTINDTDAKIAFARLLQLGTLARENPEYLPLLPVRLHLLFRSLEGIYACINHECSSALSDPNYPEKTLKYGRLYLNEKMTCDDCGSPVLELASCYQCGEAYSLLQWDSKSNKIQPPPKSLQFLRDNPNIYTVTPNTIENVTEEEEDGEEEQENTDKLPATFLISQRHGWIGTPSSEPFTPQVKVKKKSEFRLAWYRQKNNNSNQKDDNLEGSYLQQCAACGAKPLRSEAIRLFIAYTDAPLVAMIDSLFELLPEAEKVREDASKRKLLSFSDGRQDAAFFGSDYQRNHTEILYRQFVWQAFQDVKNHQGITSVNQLINRLKEIFLETSIPHPDRKSEYNYLSYRPDDPNEEKLKNRFDCEPMALARAKELLLWEFAIRFSRRTSLEALALLACHIQIEDERLINSVAERFSISSLEAQIFLTVFTDIIRRNGIVSIERASQYFPEIGGVPGARDSMLDSQGRSQNYLFLEKPPGESKKYKDSLTILPKFKKTGEKSKGQNRLGWYYSIIFSEQLPTQEDFTWLYEILKSSGILVQSQKGYQLNWNLLNLTETQQDWYKCNCCQQIIHVPGLSQLDKSQATLNLFGCPTFKCPGTLQAYTCEKIAQATNENYQQYRIKNNLPLPLRSQEHTAQLGVGELEKRENRFRRGQINMLSCSTTLEMGVDIGELQAVVLRNFPPYVSNYQQRAGRAGRRTDGVAITLMYGQRRPHDRFYFEQPEQLIAGNNQIPKLDAGNLQIQQRHIRAELLAEFLKNKEKGAEQVTIAEFFSLPLEDFCAALNFTPPANATVCELQEWLHSDAANSIAQSWINRLKISGSVIEILNQFIEAISIFQREQLADWNNLVPLLIAIREDINTEKDRTKRKGLEKRRDGIEAELEKISKRRLHDELVQASVLPIYGFPIDVVRLLTGESNEYKSSQGRHRLERDRRLALGEYAPGQDIVVDDRVYESVAILRPNDLEQKYYWVCKNCNNFKASNQEEPVDECSVCGWIPNPPSAAKMKPYKVPKAFTTDWTTEPRVTPHTKPLRQPTSQVFLAKDGENPEAYKSDFYKLIVSQGGTFFLANQGILGKGRGFTKEGFAICQSCGRDLSELVQKQRATNSTKKRGTKQTTNSKLSLPAHKHPITGRDCSGSGFPPIHLGHEFRSDLLKIQFESETKPILLFGGVINYGDDITVSSMSENSSQGTDGMGFWRSLTYALLAAAAQVIDVPRTELDGLFRPLQNRLAEIIIYDNVPGGAGYSKRIAERFADVLKKAWELATSCSCDISCYDCLRTYSNQPFHAELNRHEVAKFLKDLVVKPDPELQNFAPDASKVKVSQIAERLPAICRMAAGVTIIYLPSLVDTFNLNNGSPLLWLKLLTDAVYSVRQRSDVALELILNQLPEVNRAVTESERRNLQVLRKRLQQWIDQDLLRIYQTTNNVLPILCFNSQQQNRIALQLNQSKDNGKWEWFQTRSLEGVDTVFKSLQNLRSQARLVKASDLEDPDNLVIFPEKNWGTLTLSQLQQKLELNRVFSGSTISKIVYQDRYLNGQGATLLVNLLQGYNFDTNSSVTIRVLQNSQVESARERKADLEAALDELEKIGVSTKVNVQPMHQRSYFPHARELEVQRQDGQRYKIIFDKGMDFVEQKTGGVYCVTEPTYVVISRCG
ncbi:MULTISPECIES: DEAD/DEAH box helicase [unclassified Tolypothrix]|uniref:DEAD/DEAH box helicase n=1 Tax=unclassified Tolypothrix TaxID=2649714 RepID=UPI0005EAC7FB|nr:MULTISPECIES: DEAD/DEAH box helicase [unclassified Tolypothrix]BAY95857.1 DEAD/DEAH box helicase-like protein [Microchaete diplosiphon NIES-3275]EKE96690.1 DEAD/DEAH box helicase [Tolypothrix sp. PCC 7601]MBE9083117.1 DEAD/DEAH box helicase [Tolypothrix sp. LEGE 11397]UYD30856.1 DEAD/DEAH box helicase [Tolypothrix sp. PCC 7712]UYD38755.1 DEAD/DEAH box helicase [Tolypothrix sp. PCC 7601]